MNKSKITLMPVDTFQKIQSFGMSTAWWGKMVGNWNHINKDVMKLFYDKETGIGLTNIRYNIGAGSIDSDYIKDPTRRSISFEVSPGKYDFEKDEGTLKLINMSLEFGCEEIVFFSISPLERMTYSKKVCGSNDPNHPSNHLESEYMSYTNYVLDVVEHFLNKGYPVKYVSPINEPQWEWGVKTQTQEGCFYTKEEVATLYQLFVTEINRRNLNVELAGHDGGEWVTAIDYAHEMFKSEEVNNHMTRLDSHSYWTNKEQKVIAKAEFDKHYPEKQLVMSEWCQMQGGGIDYGMDSALVLANVLHEDLTILNVVSWQYWTGCELERFNHKVALMYMDEETQSVKPTKKLYVFGNYTKFIRPGFQRIGNVVKGEELKISSFKKDEKYVSVIINDDNVDRHIEFSGIKPKTMFITNSEFNLEEVPFEGIIPKNSVCTINYQGVI